MRNRYLPFLPYSLLAAFLVWLGSGVGYRLAAQNQAPVAPGSTIAMLSDYTALRVCAYRLDGLSMEESEVAALADLQGHYYALIKNQLDAVRDALPSLTRQRCPEIYPPKPKRVVQPPAYRRDVGSCTPTMAESNAVAAGRPLNLNTLACQIRFNLPPE